MKIAFFTGHIAGAPRKAAIQFLAESFADLGWDVRVITIGYSWLAILKGDQYRAYARTLTPGKWFDVSPRLKGYILLTMLNPSRLPAAWLNRLTKAFFRWYCSRLPAEVAAELKDADIIVVESGPGLLLMPELHRLASRTRLVYAASDRLVTLRMHPVMMDAEKAYAKLFDLISVPAGVMKADFDHPNCRFIPHGVETKAFDLEYADPYARPRNIVSVGDMLFDERIILALATALPDWTIHLFGDKARCRETPPNVTTHGEVPFEQMVPYIKFADIGLAPYRPAPSADYLSQSSLKLMQYTYARLPVIAPDFATAGYRHAIPYDPRNPQSAVQAFERARNYDRAAIAKDSIMPWSEIPSMIIRALP